MTRKLTDRSLRALQTKKKLFKSAAKLIDKYGYDDVTIEDICRKAGVSVGAFYHYYNSKSDIIVEFFKEIDYYYEDKVLPKLTGSPEENIETFLRYYAVFHVDQGIGHTSMVVKIQHDFFLDKSRYMHKMLLDLINVAKAEGVFRDNIDPNEIEDFLLVIARGLLFDWSLAHGEYDLVTKMDAYVKLAMLPFK